MATEVLNNQVSTPDRKQSLPPMTLINNLQEEEDFIDAKAFLMKASTKTGVNLYDHLSQILSEVLVQKPENVADIFEDLSSHAKKTRFKSNADTIQNKADKTSDVAMAEIQEKLFKKGGDEREGENESEDMESPLPNLLELCHYFELAGVGIGREETLRVFLALKSLNDSHPFQTIRFWGKIYGIEQNYFVAEVEYRDGEEDEQEEPYDEGDNLPETVLSKDDDEDGEDVFDEAIIPKANYKPPPTIPKEENRTGANKKTYFVCNEPGKPWTKLPQVTPAQITTARKMKKYLTGRLEASIISYPPFPGNETNYLRAQIARISAGTQISPVGYYHFDEEEEEEEEEGNRDNFMVNPEYEGLPARELIDASLANWVHHAQHILPQGRCKWFNPVIKEEEEYESGEEEEEREEPDEPEPEIGPPLLTPLSEDTEINNMPPWKACLSSTMLPQYAIAVINSNLWPGAHAFATDTKFENIYIGWGNKYSATNFDPPSPDETFMNFPSGPETTEGDDPSVSQESELREAQQEAAENAEELLDDEEEEDDDE